MVNASMEAEGEIKKHMPWLLREPTGCMVLWAMVATGWNATWTADRVARRAGGMNAGTVRSWLNTLTAEEILRVNRGVRPFVYTLNPESATARAFYAAKSAWATSDEHICQREAGR